MTARVATTTVSVRRLGGHDAWTSIAKGAPSSPAHPAERTRDEAQGPPAQDVNEARDDDREGDGWQRRRR